jgi:hypothetical protein
MWSMNQYTSIMNLYESPRMAQASSVAFLPVYDQLKVVRSRLAILLAK